MFRNIYLQSYKSSTQNNAPIEMLLTHFNHVYLTLGSILNDLEYAFGNFVSKSKQTEKNSNKVKQVSPQIPKKISDMRHKINQYQSFNKQQKIQGSGSASSINQLPKKYKKMDFDDLTDQIMNNHRKVQQNPLHMGTNQFQGLLHNVNLEGSISNEAPNKTKKANDRSKKKQQGPVPNSVQDFFDDLFHRKMNQK